MSRTVYYHFIVDNKRRCAPFFRVGEHRDYISGSHRWTCRVNEPRFYANATRVNIIFLDRFCNDRRRRLTLATFLSASNGECSLLRAAIRGSSRSIIRYGATAAADFTRYVPFFITVRIPRQKRSNEIADVWSINYKKSRAVR